MVTAIVVRELLIQGLRSHLEGQGQAVRRPDGRQAQDGRAVPVDLGRAALPGARARTSLAWLLAGSAMSSPGWPSRSRFTAAFPTSGSHFPGYAARHDVVPQSRCQLIIRGWRTLMEWLESLVLGVVQGITEFLPVSSDGHLLLTQNSLRLADGCHEDRQGKPVLRRDSPPGDDGRDPGSLSRERSPRACADCWAEPTCPSGFRASELVRVGVLAAVATSPLIPLALFFKKMIEKTFEGITFAGFGFLITAAVLMLTGVAQAPGWDKGTGGDDLARRPLDRPGPDVCPFAGSQPKRADDRGRARAWGCREPGPSASA